MARISEQERFWLKVEAESAQGCWLWLASLVKGYGTFYSRKRSRCMGAHVWAYEAIFGPVPEGMEVHHKCNNPKCVNWLHLEAIPKIVHIFKGNGFGAVNARKTHCPIGHPYSSANTYAKNGSRFCRLCMYLTNKRKRLSRISASSNRDVGQTNQQ